MGVLVNVDVPDLEAGVAFYGQAFGLVVARRFDPWGVELAGWEAPLFLLLKEAGSVGAGGQVRTYGRHWTPVHLDVVVDGLDAALARAVDAGAVVEHQPRTERWGRIATLADPFGHGLCLVQFLNRGYDEIATPGAPAP